MPILLSNKFKSDTLWNIASFFVLGVSGLLLNMVIGRWFGPTILGQFNIVFAVYIILSQISCLGVNLSCSKHSAEHISDINILIAVRNTAIMLVICFGIITGITAYFTADFIETVLHSPGVSTGIKIIIPGVFFFSINKCLLGFLNGTRRMKVYATLNSLRYCSLLAGTVIIKFIRLPGIFIPGIFTFAELFVFILSVTIIAFNYPWVTNSTSAKLYYCWLLKHVKFGIKAFPSAILIEANSRIDILMIGLFLSDNRAGLYSCAAIFAEGISQISVVFAANINPVLTAKYIKFGPETVRAIIKKGVRLSYLFMLGVCAIAFFVYPFYVKIFIKNDVFTESFIPFTILLAGIAITGGYMPFQMLFVQTGFPLVHTILITTTAASNIILNAVFIPFFGISGAAIATSISLILRIILLKIFSKKYLGIFI